MKLKLKEPLNEGKITELEMRKPKMRDLAELGIPFDQVAKTIDFKKLVPLTERLAGVDRVHLLDMSIEDSMELVSVIADMFNGQDEETLKK